MQIAIYTLANVGNLKNSPQPHPSLPKNYLHNIPIAILLPFSIKVAWLGTDL